MNAQIFEDYFQDLCESLLERGSKYQSVVIHMDNAKYHKRVDGLSRCLSSLRKGELKNWLLLKGAEPEQLEKMTRKQLYELARDKPEYKGVPYVETIAANYGFQINWLPPYHPTLNPIEEAWGIVKGYVALHNNGKDFSAVKDLIFKGFEKVTKDTWTGLVHRTYGNEDAFIEKFRILTTMDINNMIINIDTDDEDDDENDDENDNEGYMEEITFEDVIEIRDNEELEDEESDD